MTYIEYLNYLWRTVDPINEGTRRAVKELLEREGQEVKS